MTHSGSFRKVAKGGALWSLGSFSGTFLQFLSGIVVIRMLERSQFGLVSLGMTVVFMVSLLSLLGFKHAVPRFMGRYRAQGDQELVGQVAGTALACAVGMSVLFSAGLHSGSRFVALTFHKPELAVVLEVLALMVPAMVLTDTFTAVFQGTENVRPKVMFQDLAANLLRLLLLLLLVALGVFGLHALLWVYVTSVWVALAIYLLYSIRALAGVLHLQLNWAVAKELLWFSFPLLGTSLISRLMPWAATLTLGYTASAVELARFSAPMRLAEIVAVPLFGMMFLYLPVVSRMAERGKTREVQELYCNTTKWAFFVALPFLLYFFVDAEFVVTWLFGDAYRDSAEILMVMVVSVAIPTFVGPTGSTLVAFGATRTQFIAAMLGTSVAVALCLLLVPKYGAMGAAVGIAIARLVSTGYNSVVLFRRFQIHSLVPMYLKPVLLSVGGAVAAGLILRASPVANPFVHLLVFLGIALFTLCTPIFTRTLTKVDLELLGSLERRTLGQPRITQYIARWVGT